MFKLTDFRLLSLFCQERAEYLLWADEKRARMAGPEGITWSIRGRELPGCFGGSYVPYLGCLGVRLGKPCFQLVRTTDVLTIDEDLREGRCVGNRANRAIAVVSVQLQCFELDTSVT